MNDVKLKYKAIGSLAVPANGKLIYSMLLDNADEKGELQISMKEISKSLRIGRKSVSNNLRRIEKTGCIRVIPRFHTDGGRAANKYIVR